MGAPHPVSSRSWLLVLLSPGWPRACSGTTPGSPTRPIPSASSSTSCRPGTGWCPPTPASPSWRSRRCSSSRRRLFAKLFGWALPLHDAARLASAFYVFIALYCVSKTARSPHRRVAADRLFRLCAPCPPADHTDNALVAGIALAIHGFSISRTQSVLGESSPEPARGSPSSRRACWARDLLALTALALPRVSWPGRNPAFLKSLVLGPARLAIRN